MNLKICILLVAAAGMLMVNADTTPVMDIIPVISQIKQTYQMIVGDHEGARRTRENFVNEGLFTSQAKSMALMAKGDKKGAIKLQKKFASNLEPLVDGTPGVGHVKGLVHLAKGEKEKGWDAIKSATSGTGALVGGLCGGPGGAALGHAITDVAITAVGSAVDNKFKPYGFVDNMLNTQNLDAGQGFDFVAGTALEALGAGQARRLNVKSPRVVAAGSAANKAASSIGSAVDSSSLTVAGSSGRKSAISSANTQVLEETNIPGFHPLTKQSGISQSYKTGMSDTESSMGKSQKSTVPSTSRPIVAIGAKEVDPRDIPSTSGTALASVDNTLAVVPKKKITNSIDYALFLKWFKANVDMEAINKFSTNYELFQFRSEAHLKKLDVNALTNKLDYLNEHTKSLVTYNDFKTVNFFKEKTNCVSCTIAAVLKMNVEQLNSFFFEPLNLYKRFEASSVFDCLVAVKNTGLFDVAVSGLLIGLNNLKAFLTRNAQFLTDRYLILDMLKEAEESIGHTVAMKYIMANGEPQILIVDFQKQGLLLRDLPNPSRLMTFDEPSLSIYIQYVIYNVEVKNKVKTYRPILPKPDEGPSLHPI